MTAAITKGLQAQCSLFSEPQADSSPNRSVASINGSLAGGCNDKLTRNKMSWLISQPG